MYENDLTDTSYVVEIGREGTWPGAGPPLARSGLQWAIDTALHRLFSGYSSGVIAVAVGHANFRITR